MVGLELAALLDTQVNQELRDGLAHQVLMEHRVIQEYLDGLEPQVSMEQQVDLDTQAYQVQAPQDTQV